MWLVGLNFMTAPYVASWFEFLKTNYMIYSELKKSIVC